MKFRFLFGLIAAMVVLALAPSSFAQVNIQTFGAPSAVEVQTNHTAQTADPNSSGAGVTVSGSVIANVETTTTTLNLTFPGPITSSCAPFAVPGGTSCAGGTNVPANDPVRIEGQTGLFTSAYITTILFSAGVIQINLPECKGACATTTPSGSFRLVGVRIDVNGKTAPLQVTAGLVNNANGYLNGTTPQTVINALGAGVGSVAVGARSGNPAATNQGVLTIFTNNNIATNPPSDPIASIVVTEGTAASWRANTGADIAVANSAGSATATAKTTPNGTKLKFTVTGIPTGYTLTPAISIATSSVLTFTGGLGTFGGSSAVTQREIEVLTSSLSATESFQVTFVATITGTVGTLTPGAITVTVTESPTGAVADTNGTPLTPASATFVGFPAFLEALVGPTTIGNIIASQTNLLIPYAVNDLGYDTGIALANTTADPFGGSTNGGATPQAGNIQVFLFPRTANGAGTMSTLSTSATVRPGAGLATDGTLAAGGTWTVLLSALTPLATPPITGPFTGYIFITTGFLDGHGAPFISDFRNFTSATPMLVLPPPAIVSRALGTEILGL